MPIAINANKIRVKDAGTSKYLTFDVVADEATEKRIEQIEAKKNNVLASISTVAELEEMIEGAFDSTRDYTVGQYVIQEVNGVNNLYRFNANYEANSGWSSANVTKVKIGDEVTGLKNDINELSSGIGQEVLDRIAFNKKLQDSIALKADESSLIAEKSRAESEEKRIESLFTGDVTIAVDSWLSSHPEATTTVSENSISDTKFDTQTANMLNIYNNVIHFGADNTGSSYSDDAIEAAIEANKGGTIYFPSGTYLISKPIKTYDAVVDAVSIIMEMDTVIRTDQEIECLLDVGALISPNVNRYPIETYNRIIKGGVFNATGCTYAILFEDRSIQYIVSEITCINCTNGIKIGRTSELSQDVYLRNSYIVGKGSDYEGTGVVIYGNDNLAENIKIYGFRKAIFTIGGGTQILNSHALAIFRNGTNVPNFDTVYQQTLCVDNQGETILSNVYCDGYYRFVEIKNQCFIHNCTFYSYKALEGLTVSIFKIYTATKPVTIQGCHIYIRPTEGISSGISFDDSFTQDDSRIYLRFLKSFLLDKNIVNGVDYLSDGDLILYNSSDNEIMISANMSNGTTILLDTWYEMCTVVVPDTLQNEVTLHIASEDIECRFYTLHGTPHILSAKKIQNTTSTYQIGISLKETVNNYSVYGVYLKQTGGTVKVQNCYVSFGGCGFIFGYRTEKVLSSLIVRESDPDAVVEVSCPQSFKTAKISITASAGQTITTEVTFSTPFNSKPIVFLTPMTGYPNMVHVSANQITETGFNIYVYANVSVSSLQIQWVAFDIPS